MAGPAVSEVSSTAGSVLPPIERDGSATGTQSRPASKEKGVVGLQDRMDVGQRMSLDWKQKILLGAMVDGKGEAGIAAAASEAPSKKVSFGVATNLLLRVNKAVRDARENVEDFPPVEEKRPSEAAGKIHRVFNEYSKVQKSLKVNSSLGGGKASTKSKHKHWDVAKVSFLDKGFDSKSSVEINMRKTAEYLTPDLIVKVQKDLKLAEGFLQNLLNAFMVVDRNRSKVIDMNGLDLALYLCDCHLFTEETVANINSESCGAGPLGKLVCHVLCKNELELIGERRFDAIKNFNPQQMETYRARVQNHVTIKLRHNIKYKREFVPFDLFCQVALTVRELSTTTNLGSVINRRNFKYSTRETFLQLVQTKKKFEDVIDKTESLTELAKMHDDYLHWRRFRPPRGEDAVPKGTDIKEHVGSMISNFVQTTDDYAAYLKDRRNSRRGGEDIAEVGYRLRARRGSLSDAGNWSLRVEKSKRTSNSTHLRLANKGDDELYTSIIGESSSRSVTRENSETSHPAASLRSTQLRLDPRTKLSSLGRATAAIAALATKSDPGEDALQADVSLSSMPSWQSSVSISSVYTRDPNKQAEAAEWSIKEESDEGSKKMMMDPLTNRKAMGAARRNAGIRKSIHTVTALNAIWSKLLRT